MLITVTDEHVRALTTERPRLRSAYDLDPNDSTVNAANCHPVT
jgi:hypothetical protein